VGIRRDMLVSGILVKGDRRDGRIADMCAGVWSVIVWWIWV
jgi:hypothetical protein